MSDFDVVGRLSVQDDGTYLIEKANKALDQMGTSAEDAGGHFLNLGGIADNALGHLLADAAERAVSALGNLAKSALDSYASYERTGMSLEALNAMQMVQESTTYKMVQVGSTHLSLTQKQSKEYQKASDAVTKLTRDIGVQNQVVEKAGGGLNETTKKWGENGKGVLGATITYEKANNRLSDMQANLDKAKAVVDKYNQTQQQTIPIYEKVITSQMSLTEAREKSAPAVKQLLDYTQQLALLSPFKTDDVNQTLLLQMRMGATADEAKRLTTSLVNYSTAMGLDSAGVSRLGYAMAEVNSMGKLTGQTLRMLTRDGMSMQVLTSALGMSTEELEKKVSAGAISAQMLNKAFNEFTEKNFADEAKKQATSWSGLLSTLGDFKEVGLREFFQNTFQVLQPFAAGVVNWLIDMIPKIGEAGKNVGEFVAGAIPKVQSFVSTVSGMFTSLQSGIASGAFSSRAGATGFLAKLFALPPNVTKTITDIAGSIDGIGAKIKSGNILGALKQAFTETQGLLSHALTSVLTGAVGAGGGFLAKLLGLSPDAVSAVVATISTVFGVIERVTQQIRDSLISAFGNALPGIQTLIDWLGPKLFGSADGSAGIVQTTLLPALGAVFGFLTTQMIPAVGQIVGWLATNLPGAIETTSTFLNSVFGPVIERTSASIAFWIPILQQVWAWLAVNVPVAIATASAFIGRLNSDFNTISTWINTNVMPAVERLATYFTTGLGVAFNIVSTLLTTLILPAFQLFAGFMTNSVQPALAAVGNFVLTLIITPFRLLWELLSRLVFPILIQLSTLFQNTVGTVFKAVGVLIFDSLVTAFKALYVLVEGKVVPIFQTGHKLFDTQILPTFRSITTALNEGTGPAFKFLHGILDGLKDVLNWLADKLKIVAGFLGDVTKALNNFHIPAELQRHSPSPLEQTFMGLRDTLSDIHAMGMPDLSKVLPGGSSALGAANAQISGTAATVGAAAGGGPVHIHVHVGGEEVMDYVLDGIAAAFYDQRRATYGG